MFKNGMWFQDEAHYQYYLRRTKKPFRLLSMLQVFIFKPLIKRTKELLRICHQRRSYRFSCVISDFTATAPVEVYVGGKLIGIIKGNGVWYFEFKATSREILALSKGPVPGMFKFLSGGFTVDNVSIKKLDCKTSNKWRARRLIRKVNILLTPPINEKEKKEGKKI